jgi:hypothetical protein
MTREKPKNIAKVERDRDARAWNTVMLEGGARVTFGAMDKDHAQDLADMVNACAWVQVHNECGDS